jgi:YHS domain-containing protein
VIFILVRLLLAYFVVRALLRLFRGIAEGLKPEAPKPPQAVALVRDPVCGTYVVPSTALAAGAGSQTRFFCSENCRRTYVMKIAQ